MHLKIATGTSLAVQWLEHHAFTAEGMSSVPGQGTKILQVVQHSPKKSTNWDQLSHKYLFLAS